jgi:hypothetical protein
MGTLWMPRAILAQGDLLNPGLAPAGKTSGVVLTNVLIVLGVAAGLTLLAALWFYVTRKRGAGPRRRRRHHKHRPDAQDPADTPGSTPDSEEATGNGAGAPDADDATAASSSRRHRSRRRLRREHRGRNPTLAETGGLPPRRDEPGQQPGTV